MKKAHQALAGINRVGGVGALLAGEVNECGGLVAGGVRGKHGRELGGQSSDDKPTTRKPMNSSSPAKRLDLNRANAPAPSLGSALAT